MLMKFETKIDSSNKLKQKSENNFSKKEKRKYPSKIWLRGYPGSSNAILVFNKLALLNRTAESIQSKPGHKLHITYKTLQTECKLVFNILNSHGVTQVDDECRDFNLIWTSGWIKPDIITSLSPHQRVNHFPRSSQLGRKDFLNVNIKKMQYSKGFKHFAFVPPTFVIPYEFDELNNSHHRIKGPWIVKPVSSSRGRGIFIVEHPKQVPLDEVVVVSKYITNPLLIKGYKCDLRIYVVVTSFDPLIIYMYQEGFVRLATVKYDNNSANFWNPCMHLCNYSINKNNSNYVVTDDLEIDNVGHKWSLTAFLRYLKINGKDTTLLMTQIQDIIVKTTLSSAIRIVPACYKFIPHVNNCFELFGFDILVDENFKPWLIEVNSSPSLEFGSCLDNRIKTAMLIDLFTLVGIPAVDPILRPHTPSKYEYDYEKNSKKLKKTLMDRSTKLTYPEQKLVTTMKRQFNRSGDFIRLFPTQDTWSRYSHFLDPQTGLPSTGTSSVFNLDTVTRNLNQILFMQLYPNVLINTKNKHFNRDVLVHQNSHVNFNRDLSANNLKYRNRKVPIFKVLSSNKKLPPKGTYIEEGYKEKHIKK